MKRRNFINSSIAVIVGSMLGVKKKKKRLLTPTHTVEAKSKTHPTEGVRFPCILRSEDDLKIGSVVEIHWEEEGTEEFVVTKVKSTKDQHIEELYLV